MGTPKIKIRRISHALVMGWGILEECLHTEYIQANKEPFLNQFAHVILVHNWYCSTSTCFHVYSCEYTCSACCHEFWTNLTSVVLGQNWYGFTGTCHHVKNLWFHGKHVLTYHICSQNPVNSRELSQLNSGVHLHILTYRTCEITGRCLFGYTIHTSSTSLSA